MTTYDMEDQPVNAFLAPHGDAGRLSSIAALRGPVPGAAVLLPPLATPPGHVINKIEDILGNIQLDLLHQRILSIPLQSRRRLRRATAQGDVTNVAPRTSVVRFPGATPQEATKFGLQYPVGGVGVN